MRHLSRNGAAFVALVALLMLPAGPAAAGQSGQRIIPFPAWAASHDEDEEVPLELVGLEVAGMPVVLGQPFAAGDDWLKETTLRVRNISGKPIAAFSVGGGLLDAADEELAVSASFAYGIGWDWGKWFDPEKKEAATTVFEPGEVVELSRGNVGERTWKVLAARNRGSFSKLKFMAPGVQYADGEVASMPNMRFYGEGKPEKSR